MSLEGTDKIYAHSPAPPRLTDLFKPSKDVPSSATGQGHNIAPFEENVTVKLTQIAKQTVPQKKRGQMQRTTFTVHHGSMTLKSIPFYSIPKRKHNVSLFLVP